MPCSAVVHFVGHRVFERARVAFLYDAHLDIAGCRTRIGKAHERMGDAFAHGRRQFRLRNGKQIDVAAFAMKRSAGERPVHVQACQIVVEHFAQMRGDANQILPYVAIGVGHAAAMAHGRMCATALPMRRMPSGICARVTGVSASRK